MSASRPEAYIIDAIFSGSQGWVARFGGQPVSRFHGASMIAEIWGVSRETMEVFALESHNLTPRARIHHMSVLGDDHYSEKVTIQRNTAGTRITLTFQ
jgi:acetyl-CoA acetyltransferase